VARLVPAQWNPLDALTAHSHGRCWIRLAIGFLLITSPIACRGYRAREGTSTRETLVDYRPLPTRGKIICYDSTAEELLMNHTQGSVPYVSRYAWQPAGRSWRLVRSFRSGRVHPWVASTAISALDGIPVVVTLAENSSERAVVVAHTFSGQRRASVTVPYPVVNVALAPTLPVLAGNRGVRSPDAPWPQPLVFINFRTGLARLGPTGLSAVPLSESTVLYAEYAERFSACDIILWSPLTDQRTVVGRYQPALGFLSPLPWLPQKIAAHEVSTHLSQHPNMFLVDLRTGTKTALLDDAMVARPHRLYPLVAYVDHCTQRVGIYCLACWRLLEVDGQLRPYPFTGYHWSVSGPVLYVPLAETKRGTRRTFPPQTTQLALIDCSSHLSEKAHRLAITKVPFRKR